MRRDFADPRDPSNWMMVTITYRGDIEQFRLLNESFKRFAPPGMHHTVVVDRRDRELFEEFRHDRQVQRTIEDLFPGFVKKISWPKNLWVGRRLRPNRGWIVQQLAKISATLQCDRPYVLIVDSDVFFTRPFSVSRFTDGENLAVSRVNNFYDQLADWRQTSAKVLDLDNPSLFVDMNYVTSLVPWQRSVVKAMVDRIEDTTNKSWLTVLSSQKSFSEFTLYGVFAEEVLGLDAAGLYGWDSPSINYKWDDTILFEDQFVDVIQDRSEDFFGVMFHSKNEFDRTELHRAAHRCWTNQ